MLTRQVVRELFMYEPSTGWLIRRVTRGTSAKGVIVGRPHGKGHLHVNIDGKTYQVHRVVWMYHYGWLPGMLDHKDTNPANNMLENLRPASRCQNAQNANRRIDNKAGYKGIHLHRPGVWRSGISVNTTLIDLGLFESPEDAHATYCIAANKYHKEFKRTH